ncbi:unnamed protein product [Knipowitschia caucasica]|uniref:Centrosomal protein of 19 kDa n=1 Tax=Knipowitschia caucasica TaxID=637954 RepID=A0AAV2KXJ5_KNICA
MNFKAKRCGVQFSPPSIVLIYENNITKKLRKRIIPLREFSRDSDHRDAAERLKNHPRHSDYLQTVPQSQLERLHIIIRDNMKGLSLEQSLASFQLDPEQDLNKLDDEELSRKKGKMDELFEKNRKRKDDPNFVYDVEVEFSANRDECSWDESDDGF